MVKGRGGFVGDSKFKSQLGTKIFLSKKCYPILMLSNYLSSEK